MHSRGYLTICMFLFCGIATAATINPFLSRSSIHTAIKSRDGALARRDDDESVIHAHGAIMGVVFLGLYPLGAILMPLLHRWKLHIIFQLSALALSWIGFGLGFMLSQTTLDSFLNYHTVLGVVLLALLSLQPILGFLHHQHYIKHQARGTISYFHIVFGYVLIVIGLVEEGLGLFLAEPDNIGHIIAYATIAGSLAIAYTVFRWKLTAIVRKWG